MHLAEYGLETLKKSKNRNKYKYKNKANAKKKELTIEDLYYQRCCAKLLVH